MSFITSLGDWLRKVSKSFTSATISNNNIVLTRHNNDNVTLPTSDIYTVKSANFVDNQIIFERYSPTGVRHAYQIDNRHIGEDIDIGWYDYYTDTSQVPPHSSGAFLSLRSKNFGNSDIYRGSFILAASNEDDYCYLEGRANGTLQWGRKWGRNTVLTTNNISAGNNIAVTLDTVTGGLIISATDTTYNTATASEDGLMSATDKTKLDGIETGAEVNQNTYSNIKVGSTTVTANGKTATIELVAGTNVTLTPDATNNKITIEATDTVYTHPTTSGNKHIPSGGSSGQILRWSADGTAEWGADSNTTYTIGTASGSGNAITALSISGDTITPILGKTFSESGHTHPYLPASGGTMTGTIYSNSAYLSARRTNAERLILLGGSSFNNNAGAQLELRGADYVNGGGLFSLCASDANRFKYLIGTPDGRLTWDGTNVIYTHPTSAGNKHIPSGGSSGQILIWSASGTATWNNPPFVKSADISIASQVSSIPHSFKFKHPSGLMIQAYYNNTLTTDSNGQVTWTYDEAFIEQPFVQIQKLYSSQDFVLYSINSSRVILRCNNMSGTALSSGTAVWFNAIAIGRWK